MNTFASNLIYGGIAGIIGTSTVFPLDMVKTRLQNQAKSAAAGGVPQYNGVIDTFKKVIKADGVRGLYRGLAANLVGVTPEKAIKLSANDFFRAYYGGLYFGSEEKAKQNELPVWVGALAGGSAGLCQVVATNPMELVKIRMQLQSQQPADVPRKSTIQVVKDLGIKGLYKGTAATLMRDIPFSMIYFSLYAKFKDMLKKPGETLPFYYIFGASIAAGMIASATVTPADVIKTRLQAAGSPYTGIMNCATTTIKNEGAAALFKGVVPRMLIISPLFGITLMVYEVQQRFFQQKHSDRR